MTTMVQKKIPFVLKFEFSTGVYVLCTVARNTVKMDTLQLVRSVAQRVAPL